MREDFWLIENTRFSSPAFYAENKCYRWMPFCEDVVRYATEQAARDALAGFTEAADCIVTEHSII
jgi:hypothetical protein